MIFIRQFAVLELNRLALGQKRDLYRVFAGSIIGQSASSLCLFFCHDCSCISPCASLCFLWLGFENLNHRGHRGYSNSAFAMGCGAVGPSPRSVSSMFLPFSAVETAVSIIISANRIVPWFSGSIALRIAW